MYRLLLAGAASVAAALLLFSPAPVRADDQAQALLAKHRAFIGWQLGDGTFSSMQLTREYTDDKGKTTERVSERRVGLAYRNTYTNLEHANLTEDSGFTGNIFWDSNVNGFTTPAYGDLAKYLASYNALVNEALAGLPASSRGTATVDGKALAIVRVDVPHADALDLYVDPDSGAYGKVVIDPDGTYERLIRILSYTQALPGKKVIGSYQIGTGPGIYKYTKIEPNVVMRDQDLHPPSPSAVWTFSNPQPFPIKVTPYRFYVDATVNGVSGRFIIDSGASGIFLSRSFANKAAVKVLTGSQAAGITGTEKTDVVKIDSLTIGGNTLSNVIAESGNVELDEDANAGLIGFDLFGGALVTLDSEAATLTIADPSVNVPDANAGISTIVDLSDRVPVVPMKLNESIDVKALLDSGDPTYVFFAHEIRSRYHLSMLIDDSLLGLIQSHPYIGGVGGTLEVADCGYIDSLTLGPIKYGHVRSCLLRSFEGRNALVGFDFLKHFNLVFDYPHGKIIMIPHKE